MLHFQARRVLSAFKRGNSWPVLVKTDAGHFVTKLRGAGQGSAALIAEVLVASLAEALELPVPERVVIEFPMDLPSDDRNDELLQLLRASEGQNLGFRHLPGASELGARELDRVDPAFAARVLWLDAWVMNLDRSPANPNILSFNGQLWLIDHGAALPFQHELARVTEQDPSSAPYTLTAHLFASHTAALQAVDAELTPRFSFERLCQLAEQVPEPFLQDAFPGADLSRLPIAYAAYLWKRLKPPRKWLEAE